MQRTRKRTYASRISARASSRPQKKGRALSTAPRWAALRPGVNYTVQPTLRCKLTYCDYYTINPGAGGAAGVYVFSANGLYDPNITGVGHQPAGFDELMAIWSEYIVIGSTIKTYFRCTESQQPGMIAIAVKKSATALNDLRIYIENGEIVHGKVEGFDSGGPSIASLSYRCDMNQAKTNLLTDPDFLGTASANPFEQRYYHVIVQAFDATSDLAAWQMWTEIEYDVLLRDRITTNLS